MSGIDALFRPVVLFFLLGAFAAPAPALSLLLPLPVFALVRRVARLERTNAAAVAACIAADPTIN